MKLAIDRLMEALMEKMMPWFVYMIQCSDGSLYTGISTDPKRRFQEHQSGRGAKYFNAHTPLQISYLETADNRSQASKREAAIKKLSRHEKQRLIHSLKNQIKECSLYLKLD